MSESFTSRLREALEVLAGFRGSDNERAVRVKELGAVAREVARRSGETIGRQIDQALVPVTGQVADAQQAAVLAGQAAADALAAAQAAQAGFDGLAEFGAFKVQAGNAVSLLELFALSNPNLQLSVARLAADQIILDGSVGTELLVVGLGRNLAINTNFLNGLRHWDTTQGAGSVSTQTTIAVRLPGETWAGATYRTVGMYQAGVATDGHRDFQVRPLQGAGGTASHGVPCAAGEWFEFSAKVSTHRCNGQVLLWWFDAAGAFISAVSAPLLDNVPGSSTNPEAWNRFWVKGQAPPTAAFVRASVRKFGTSSGADSWIFVYKPMLAASHEFAVAPATYSPDGSTLIEGSSIITGSVLAPQIGAQQVTADKMAANSITAANAALGDLAVSTFKIQDNAVTITRAASSATVHTTDSWFTIASLTFTPVNVNGRLVAWLRALATTTITGADNVGTAEFFFRALWRGAVVVPEVGFQTPILTSARGMSQVFMDMGEFAAGSGSGTLEFQGRTTGSSFASRSITLPRIVCAELAK